MCLTDGLGDRQGGTHHRPRARRRRLDPDAASLRLDEPSSDRQAETDALPARIVRLTAWNAIELLEDLLARSFGDAGALVFDRQLDVGARHDRADTNGRAGRRVLAGVVEH